jgi:hypothetical protein
MLILQVGHSKSTSASQAVTRKEMLTALAEGTAVVKVTLLHNCTAPTVKAGEPAAAAGQEERFRKDVAAFGRLMHAFICGVEQSISGCVL